VFPTWAKAVVGGLALLLLLSVALFAALSLRNRRLRHQRARLLEEVGILQEALLPVVPDRVGGLAVSVAYRPAEGLSAGGDFYDVFALDGDATAIIVGDVSGHGRDSLAPATFIRHMVRSYLEAGMSPRAALQLAGNILDDQDREDFATIIVAVYDSSAGTLAYAGAGHPPPIVTGPNSYEPLTVASSPPAGVGVTTGQRQTTIALPPGSRVCFYTDGLTEARTGSGYYGRAKLEEVVERVGDSAGAQDVVDQVARATTRFCDDVAVCMIRVDEGPPAGGVRVEEIEVTRSDLETTRLRRFFAACGVSPADAAVAVRTARPQIARLGSVLLRVRLADRRSGVDVVPVATAIEGADVVPVSNIR
jgi:serine phosphatase RsbU (regulator of sigma subunit)